MGNTYYWTTGGGGNWNNPSSWAEVSPGYAYPSGPPGAGDVAAFVYGTVTGDGTVGLITAGDPNLGPATFTGTITSSEFIASGVTADGAVLSASGEFFVSEGYALVGENGAILNGPTDANPVGNFGTAGFVNVGTISLTSATLNSYVLDDFGTLDVNTGAVVSLTTLAVTGIDAAGTNPAENGSVVMTAGSISDALGLIGAGLSESSTVTISGGIWSNQQLLIGSTTGALLAISNGVSVTATGGFATNPAVPEAFALGNGVYTAGGLQTGYGTLTLDGSGSYLGVTGDADIGVGGTGIATISAGTSMDVTGTLNGGTVLLHLAGGTLTVEQAMTVTGTTSTLTIDTNGLLQDPASSGTITIAGTIDINSGTILGHNLYARGPASVQDGTIQANELSLGSEGATASSTLYTGGVMNAAIADIGALSGDKALVRMFGNSLLQASAEMFVGGGGHGGLDIEGGVVRANGGISEASPALDLGALDASTLGTIAMDGTGSTLSVVGAAVLGDAGAGSVLLGTQSSFTISYGLYEGAQVTGGGTLLVVDKTDTFSIGGDWVIGDAGGHTDTIEGGASASVGGALTIARSGGLGSLTVTDAGSAVGVSGDITVGQSGSGTLQVETGAVLTSSHGNFVVQSGSADIGTGAQVSAADATVDSTGTLTLGDGTLTATGSVAVAGTVSGHGTIAGPIVDTGTITASGGTLLVQGSVTGSGKLDISGATMELQAGIGTGPTIDFAGGTLVLDAPTPDGAVIADFGGGDEIVLKGVIANAGTFASGTLVVDDGGAPQASLSFTGSYTSDNFSVSSVGGQTTVTYVPCFTPGTRIRTVRGDVAVEALTIGDRVVTASGTMRPVCWIGHRRIDLTRHPAPELVQPIRIRADALADGVPAREMRLSPDHAVLLDGMLVPVRLLVNGASILRETGSRSVTYLHVELDAHDVLLADNVPAESYLETGNRNMFDGAGGPLLLHPFFTNDQARREAESCAPLATDPAWTERMWRRLAVRAGQLGLRRAEEPRTNDDPDLCIVADGRRLPPVDTAQHCYVFVLPAGCRDIALVSRTAVPSDLRPWLEDRRRLGVMLRSLVLRNGSTSVPVPLDHPSLRKGWWAPEWHDSSTLRRWTDGRAVVSEWWTAGFTGPVIVEVTLADVMRYALPAAVAIAA